MFEGECDKLPRGNRTASLKPMCESGRRGLLNDPMSRVHDRTFALLGERADMRQGAVRKSNIGTSDNGAGADFLGFCATMAMGFGHGEVGVARSVRVEVHEFDGGRFDQFRQRRRRPNFRLIAVK